MCYANVSHKMFGITFLVLCFIGVLGARQPDIDINRLHLLPKEESNLIYPIKDHNQKYQSNNKFDRYNDHDYRSGWSRWAQSSVRNLQYAKMPATTKVSTEIHEPREDPRLFYQSDLYLKENHRPNINFEVSSIYPGTDVIQANEQYNSLPTRLRNTVLFGTSYNDHAPCVRCPSDRTLVAKAGFNRVILQYPELHMCSRSKAPRNIKFVHMYGPTFGSLIDKGSHVVIGRITHEDKTLQVCKMQIHVMTQGCPVPKDLIADCTSGDNSCNFTCRDITLELHGYPTLVCGENMKWKGELPFCKARTSCDPPLLPDHGHISCQGATVGHTSALVEGSKCRVRCAVGYHWMPRAVAVCRRGLWTTSLKCQPKRMTMKSHN